MTSPAAAERVHFVDAAGARIREAEARARGHVVAPIAVADRASTLASFAHALAFPPYFGHTWDALADCLADLSWLPAAGYLLVLDVAATTTGEVLAMVVEICREAADGWSLQGVCFEVAIVARTA